MAAYRARETERPDAVFRDPFARELAGERGEQIARSLPFTDENAWTFLSRTYLFDRYIARVIKAGAGIVVNLAAGLDTRPYRLDLPPALRWVEVDLPDILDYKEEILAGMNATPRCVLERVRMDLSNHDARRGLFNRLGREAAHVAVISEGLVVYLMRDEVCALARDLAGPPSFVHWIVDIASPGVIEMMEERLGDALKHAGAPLLFAPPEGPAFFTSCGWTPIEVGSLLQAARKLGRLPLFLRMMAMLPEPPGPPGSRPWAGVCVLARQA